MTRLLYRVVPHNGGVVFAEEERARLIATIHHALETATTWGEFRSLVPPAVYVDCIEDMEFGDEDQTEPDPNELFDGPVLMSDGDYPPWLQAEMDRVIPYDLLQRYGKSEQTFVSGDFWNIPKANIEPLVAELRALGFEVEEAQDLEFY